MQIFVPRPNRAQNTISAIQQIKRLVIVVLGAGKNRPLGQSCASGGMIRHLNIRGSPFAPLQKHYFQAILTSGSSHMFDNIN
jgi:hypothetical protein